MEEKTCEETETTKKKKKKKGKTKCHVPILFKVPLLRKLYTFNYYNI